MGPSRNPSPSDSVTPSARLVPAIENSAMDRFVGPKDLSPFVACSYANDPRL